MWITVYIPKDAIAGEYSGSIKISINGQERQTLKMNVKVLPFELPKPILNYSIYYLSRYSDTYKGRAIVKYKNEQQMLYELKDMIAHGINNPTVIVDHEELPDGTQDLNKLTRVIELRKKAGIPNIEPLLYVDWKVTYKEDIKKYKVKVKKIIEIAKRERIDEVYIYGKDEASEAELKKMRDIYKTVHEVGGKNFVAGWLPGFLKYASDVLDLFIVNGMWNDPRPSSSSVSGPTPELIIEAKKFGKRMYLYNNPQMGLEEPETYRRNFGFYLWMMGMDGACNYAYQEGDPWDDFNSNPRYRSHTMSYPTVKAPISTLQWEGWREGVDDVRYLTLLIQQKVEKKIFIRNEILKIGNPYKIREIITEELLKND